MGTCLDFLLTGINLPCGNFDTQIFLQVSLVLQCNDGTQLHPARGEGEGGKGRQGLGTAGQEASMEG